MILNKVTTITLATVSLLLAVFLIYKFDQNHDVKLAKTYIKEYRFAKALNLLNNRKKKNPELQQLLFYAAIKAKNFNTAAVILEDIKAFDADFKKNFYEIVKVLYKKDKDELLNQVLAKSGEVKLEQEYLISLSKKQKNIDKEMQVLLMGRKLFLDLAKDSEKEVKIDKLEKYILERYMNQANLFIAHQDYKAALEQMKEAKILMILEENQQGEKEEGSEAQTEDYDEYKDEKADYKYLLGTIYKFLGNQTEAWQLIKASADLGNIQAKDSLEQAKRKYRKR